MDIEKIVNNSIQKLVEDYELRREIILNILHYNIDSLVNNAEIWFKKEVPSEYKSVIRSLLSITTTFLEAEMNVEQLMLENKIEKVNICQALNNIINDFQDFMDNKIITVEDIPENLCIMTSIVQFKNAITTILLAFYLFMDEKSRCQIRVNDEKNNVLITIQYNGLSDIYPGLEKIQKSFFPYAHGKNYKVGIGINSALYSLRNIGSKVRLNSADDDSSLIIEVTFPSIDFLKVVDTIRKHDSCDDVELKQGKVLILIQDFVVEMILREILKDNGYEVVKLELSALETGLAFEDYKAIIVDYAYIIKYFINFSLFDGYIHDFKKVIIMYGSDDEELVAKEQKKFYHYIKKPFRVDEIVKKIEGE